MVEEIENTPPLREAAELQTRLWLGDGYEAQLEAAEREGDPGALACLRGNKDKVFPFDAAAFSKTKVEVRKMGGLSDPSESPGEYP